MTIDDELDFLFSLGNKVSKGACLGFRERLIARPVVTTEIGMI
jgi:hypothetical protein